MIANIVKLFRALNSNSKPSEIANALCLGLILGFMPKNNLLIKQWRTVIAGAVKNSKIGKAIGALPIISKIAAKASELV